MEQDIEKIKKVYEDRMKEELISKKYQGKYALFVTQEREFKYAKIIKKHFSTINDCLFIEIGAGTGGNLNFFYKLGVPYENMVANELLEERAIKLKENYPNVNVQIGNALDINANKKFDIVFQSTVFTSILNDEFRVELANKMWELLKDEGIILWYDFIYDNPSNKNVKKVTKNEIKMLFPQAKKMEFYKVTLAPPIGRKVGNLYNLINKFNVLRTHLIAVIYK